LRLIESLGNSSAGVLKPGISKHCLVQRPHWVSCQPEPVGCGHTLPIHFSLCIWPWSLKSLWLHWICVIVLWN